MIKCLGANSEEGTVPKNKQFVLLFVNFLMTLLKIALILILLSGPLIQHDPQIELVNDLFPSVLNSLE